MVGDILRQRVVRNLAPEGTIRRDLIHLLKEMLRGHKTWHVAPANSQVSRSSLAVMEKQTKQDCLVDVAPPAEVAKADEPTPAERLRHWYFQNEPTPEWLHEQRLRQWPADAPLISLLVPIRSRKDLRRVLSTLKTQTYARWEVVFIVATKRTAAMRRCLQDEDERIRFQAVPTGVAAANCLEEARQLAGGGLVGVLSPTDSLSLHALAEMADHLLRHPELDVIYCDEDCISWLGRRHGLRLKPDWSPEMLLGFNYVGRLCLIRRDVLDSAGGFDRRFEDAQEYETLLRVTEKTARIGRVPLCLCHRRTTPLRGVALGAVKHRERALREHLRRLGHAATVTTRPNGMHRVEWPIAKPPLVSIIIPTLNQPDILRQCVEDLRHKTDYPRREIILVDNGSTDKEVHDYYRELTRVDAAKVVPFPQRFNYSAACNLGARHASGELLLFLNNDISVIEPDWLTEMARFALRPGVGCVGTKLVYPNGRVQHAGVVVGVHLCGLLYYRDAVDHWDEFGGPDMYRNLLGVMGACQMVSRTAFDAVGGFDERYRIANSDMALCLRLHRAGLRTVYTPQAALVHYESYTRGNENPIEDTELLARDMREMQILADPYFHPALSPHSGTPRLRLDPELSSREFLQVQLDKYCRSARAELDPRLGQA